mgnify:CR=1 FL=1
MLVGNAKAVDDLRTRSEPVGPLAGLAMTIKDIRPAEEIPRLLTRVAQVEANVDAGGNVRGVNRSFPFPLSRRGNRKRVETRTETNSFPGGNQGNSRLARSCSRARFSTARRS